MTGKPNGYWVLPVSVLISIVVSPVLAADSQIQKSISKITTELSNLPKEHQPTLVLDLQDLSGRTVQFGKYVSDQIRIGLANSKKVEVLDRNSLAALFEERRLAETGVVNEKTAVEFGESLGAKTVIYGTLADFNKNLEITVKVIDIGRGVTLHGISERIRKTKSIERMIDQISTIRSQVAREVESSTDPSRDSGSEARPASVDQKLHDALQQIYEGRYDLAINKCQQVLRIAPNNVTALGRMGAAYYLLGDKNKAISLWKQALELESNNQTAIEYLKQVGQY